MKKLEYTSMYGVSAPDFVCLAMKHAELVVTAGWGRGRRLTQTGGHPKHCHRCGGTGIAPIPIADLNYDVLKEIEVND